MSLFGHIASKNKSWPVHQKFILGIRLSSSKIPKLISKPYKNQYSFFKISAITLLSFGLLGIYEYEYFLVDNETVKINPNTIKANIPPLNPVSNSATYVQGIYSQSLKEAEENEKKKKTSKVSFYAIKLKQQNLSILSIFYYRLMYMAAIIEMHSIENFNCFVKNPFLLSARTLELLFFILIPTLYHYKFSSSHFIFVSKLLETIETRGGPTFVKLAQWASSRSDLFSQETCDQLGKLHSMNKPHSLNETLLVIPEEYGQVLIDRDNSNESNTEDGSKMLLGSGAVGQVYTLNNNTMAIKVIHPKVRDYISRDLAIMKFFGNLLNKIPNWEWLSIPEEVEQFSVFLKTQLDFRIESCNMIKFRDLFSDNNQVYFPNIYSSGKDYIVEELVDGVSLSDLLDLKQNLMQKKGYERVQFYFNDISNIFVQSFLDMLILKNFIHADLHPGNIIVSLDKKNEEFKKLVEAEEVDVESFENIFKNEKILLNYIDTGLTIQLTPKNRINFINLFEQLCNYDGVKIGNLLIERSKTPNTVIHRDEFIEECDSMMKAVAKEEFTLGNFSIGDLLSHMMSLVRKHHIKLESEFVGVIVGLFILEGVSKRLDKDIKFFEEFVKYIVLNV
ncbi:hypothetical protein QEN19_002030 [Hanseniaspora menglaensis]